MKNHWLDGVSKILSSSSSNLIELAELAGANPRTVYRFADLSKCDLRGQDLRGIDFTGSIIEGAVIDESTKIDPEFDFRNNRKEYFEFLINRDLNYLLNLDAENSSYTYNIWHVKYLMESAYKLREANKFIEFCHRVCESKHIRKYYDCTIKSQCLSKSIQLQDYMFPEIMESFSMFDEVERVSGVLVSIMLYIRKAKHSVSDLESVLQKILLHPRQPSRRVSEF